MGATCCSQAGVDTRPLLKVYIGTATDIQSSFDRKDKGKIETFVQLRYGSLQGTRNDKIVISETIKSYPRKCSWNQLLFIPISSRHSKYSLEVSVWQLNNSANAYGNYNSNSKHQCGKAIILYNSHPGNRESIDYDSNIEEKLINNENIKHYLPGKSDYEKKYKLQLINTDEYGNNININNDNDNENKIVGNITIKCTFIEPSRNMDTVARVEAEAAVSAP